MEALEEAILESLPATLQDTRWRTWLDAAKQGNVDENNFAFLLPNGWYRKQMVENLSRPTNDEEDSVIERQSQLFLALDRALLETDIGLKAAAQLYQEWIIDRESESVRMRVIDVFLRVAPILIRQGYTLHELTS